MKIVIDSRGRASLRDPRDFDGFAVFLGSNGGDPPPGAIEALGRLDDGDHVYVDRAKVVELAGTLGREPGWLSSFGRMAEFAQRHGWVDDAGRIRAHIERGDAAI